MVHHELKTWPRPFSAVAQGCKAYEVRKDDRGYEVGHVLKLLEYDPVPVGAGLTGAEILAEVTYLTRGPNFGVPEGMVVMSIRVLDPGSFRHIRTLPPQRHTG